MAIKMIPCQCLGKFRPVFRVKDNARMDIEKECSWWYLIRSSPEVLHLIHHLTHTLSF